MNKVLFYAMTGEKSCLMHVLMNAVDLADKGWQARVIFEGRSVLLVQQLKEEGNPHFARALSLGLIAGICLACSKTLGVYEDNLASGLPMLSDMNGHAGMKPFLEEGCEVISI